MTLATSQVRQVDCGSIAAMMARDGYVFLKHWHSDEQSEVLLHRVGRTLSFGSDSPVHRVVPQSEAAPNTYSGLYGLNAFPLHSDMAHWRNPPQILMLRCIKGHESVATLLVDGADVVDYAGEEKLSRALVKPRRRLKGALPLLPLYRTRQGERASLLRWDEKFIIPASPAGEEGMNLVRKAIIVVTTTSISLCNPGDTLFIDNWRMLHGRSAVVINHADRILERAYLGELY